ncbi:MAG: conjugative transfer signal peptidase TraF [Candidatus Binataceae bacterium]
MRLAPQNDCGRPDFAAPVPLAVAMLIVCAVLFLGRFLQLRITLTDSSAPAGVYRISESSAGRGALVAACLPAPIARQGLERGYLRSGDCPAGAEPVAKVIGALPGDQLEIREGWVAVNGVRFANSQTATYDSAHRPLSHVTWGLWRVAPGDVWLFGFNNDRSWDARYFGPVPLAAVLGALRPVVTW